MASLRSRPGALLGVLVAVIGLAAFSLGAPGIVTGADTDVPPPGNELALTADDTTAAVGGTVNLTAVITDDTGSAVAGVDCTFSIVSQPGNDASLGTVAGTTDANGAVTVTLKVGSAAGAIEVGADCGGLAGTVSVVAGTVEGPALPPASLPETGTGYLPNSDSGGNTILFALIAAFGVMLMGAGLIAVSRARPARES